MRHSHVVYVLIRLATTAGTWLLLRRHDKWGDWSLVGGHVENHEMHDWQLAAAREAEEELAPLKTDHDFKVRAIHPEPLVWGPEASRSAQGQRTMYHIQYYALEFMTDPLRNLRLLPASDFLLVDQQSIDTTRYSLGRPLHQARRYLQGGLESIPPVWGESIDFHALPTALHSK